MEIPISNRFYVYKLRMCLFHKAGFFYTVMRVIKSMHRLYIERSSIVICILLKT